MRLRDFISLVEDAMQDGPPRQTVYFHVTLSSNLKAIMEQGLRPTVGDRSKQMGEHAAVFLFPSEQDAEQAVLTWLGDQFEEEQQLALLQVTVPPEIEVHTTNTAEYDCWVKDAIPAKCITILNKDF